MSLASDLDEQGFAILPRLLSPEQCAHYAGMYAQDPPFRKRVVMARHGFGSGEYKYFDYPLPSGLAGLRGMLYALLAPVANAWHEALGIDARFPLDHDALVAQCRAAGQPHATPLILRYVAGDYNRLHQDLYGDLVFPLQVAILLSRPGHDFSGGEFVLTEQRPRMQSRPIVVPLAQGDGVAFPVRHRAGTGPRGFHRIQVRHGVSALRSGMRYTLGIIFHDANS